ncbi:MAG: aspartate/glutamate racemase family protein [Planctomycetes bacterium]|nr:aspartate/glutamate racemase family protein [Planctomycetota bacterium]
MIKPSIIGVVGGVGPYAGLDLVSKIFDQTIAENDQQHLSIALLSIPSRIEPRTEFLLGEIDTNPGEAVADIIGQLEQLGAAVIGIPCNTMFAPPIFDVIVQKSKSAGCKLEPVHMIKNAADFIGEFYPEVRKVGLLCTRGTYLSNIYQDCLEPAGLEVILPHETARRELVHDSILDQEYGIKAHSNPVTERSRNQLLQVISDLEAKGAQAVILGCTELPLAITERKIGSMIMIDPTMLLARKLINLIAPDKLKPLKD